MPMRRKAAWVGLVAAPGITDRTFMGLPAFLELEGVTHDPTQDRARGNAHAQLPSQFGEVAVAEFETQIPAHASYDDVVGEPALTKQRVTGGAMGNHAPESRRHGA